MSLGYVFPELKISRETDLKIFFIDLSVTLYHPDTCPFCNWGEGANAMGANNQACAPLTCYSNPCSWHHRPSSTVDLLIWQCSLDFSFCCLLQEDFFWMIPSKIILWKGWGSKREKHFLLQHKKPVCLSCFVQKRGLFSCLSQKFQKTTHFL